MSYQDTARESTDFLVHDRVDTAVLERADEFDTPAVRPGPEICYVDETEIASMIRGDELGRETDIAVELGAARNAEERVRLVRTLLRMLGYSGLAYLAVKMDKLGRPERVYVLRNYMTTNIATQMLEAGFLERESDLHGALTSDVPQVWDLKSLVTAWRESGDYARGQQLADQMRDKGVCSGLSFGVSITHTTIRSIVSFTSPRHNAAWINDNVVAQSLALGLSLHQRCSAYIKAVRRRETAGVLSQLQQRILSLLVLGLSDKEIAIRLDTTAHNVDYHLRQLRDKYKALNRSHLAFVAAQTQGV
ncbi:autoinducer binding domain-containing protein [Trinickia sp. LjRoot230]|uniref:helix-turn-helix transcriptional regulator n=1 Tax=Trinickia sp. LjRoot230 TaxID=3342288 RepID=UPI003ECF3029